MSDTIYDTSSETSRANFVTIAQALPGGYQRQPRLNKTIYSDGREKPYDHAKFFKYHLREIYSLGELASIVSKLLAQPRFCLLRGIAKDYDKTLQLRRLYDDPVTGQEATMFEKPLNWFALDVDNNDFLRVTGDLARDTYSILALVGLAHYECFAIASAGFNRKPGIHLRVFLWADQPVTCLDLKKHFADNKAGIDLALFSPIQPIFTARPTFVDRVDPIVKQMVWLPGAYRAVNIVHREVVGKGRAEEQYTAQQASMFLRKHCLLVQHTKSGDRHTQLYNSAIFMGKLIGQNIIDEDVVLFGLFDACQSWANPNPKKDKQTMMDGIARGIAAIENTPGAQEYAND